MRKLILAFATLGIGTLVAGHAAAQQPANISVRTVAVAPVRGAGTPAGVYQDTVLLLKWFESLGYRVSAVNDSSDPQPGDQPYLFVIANKFDKKYCLEGVVQMQRAPQPFGIGFEQRVVRTHGESTLTDEQCARRFAQEVKARLKKANID